MNDSLKGCIGFSGPKANASWLQKLIMFFTASKWSHGFIVTFPVEGEEMVMEAQMAVCTVPLARYRGDVNCAYEIYQPQGIVRSDEVTDRALLKGYHEWAGTRYGFLQLPCFVIKWVYEKLRIPMIHLPDWVRQGIICSEVQYDYLTEISLSPILNFDPDLVSPQDLYGVVKAHPELFQLVESQ